MENFRKALWILFYYPIYGYNYWKTRNIRRRLNLLKSEDTVQYILQNKCSVSRYGDGELQMMSHYMQKGDSSNFHVDTFQNFNQDLAKRLVDVYQKGQVKHLVCLPYSFKKTTGYGIYEELFWKREWLGRYKMLSDLSLDRMFGDTNFTRFYMGRSDIHNYDEYIKTKLVLIALGHTATVLAYDLSLLGFQAIDVGHIDIEYEWYRMDAKSKMPVPNKYVNEVASGRISTEYLDNLYLSQIIGRIS